jgi:hypothetical protein
MRFRTSNILSFFKTDSLNASIKSAIRMWVRFSGSAGGQMGGRWHERAGECTFFYGKGKENHELGTGSFVLKGYTSAVKRAEFVSDRMLHIILRGRWCHIIVWTFMPQQKIKLTMWRTASTRNWNVCWINSLNTIRKMKVCSKLVMIVS